MARDGVRAGAALSSPDGMIAGAEGSAIDALRAGQAEEQCLFYVGIPSETIHLEMAIAPLSDPKHLTS